MNYKVVFTTPAGKTYKLGFIDSIEITKSVENLADVATIILPQAIFNTAIQLESTVTRGTKVEIQLGYNNVLRTEFVGYVREITTNESLKIECEDALFLFRKSVPNKSFKTTSTKSILQYLVDHVDTSFKVNCDYDITYEKFTIYQATAYDVLKKLLEETKGNMYFDTQNKVLHMHPPYSERTGQVRYSMQRNVEKSSLEYKKAIDRKFQITVECVKKDGTKQEYKAGTDGGDQITLKVGAMSTADLKKIADAELLRQGGDKYEGSLDSWLIPFVEPSYSAKIEDADYPEKDGRYYVTSVKTSFSEAGAKRVINLGIKLS